ncbi:WAT1-related protein At3g02690, chloroplastic [Coffea arabica]|uniref:WAT1-related protein At3g02690, chloroplastic n=1 Tax=Coffea arabica TaxID=13443 RepID=A0A6P6TMH2_COFAR|nr:WAT1-related protein At3g02690, chloroplastic-like [Coffea arabica]
MALSCNFCCFSSSFSIFHGPPSSYSSSSKSVVTILNCCDSTKSTSLQVKLNPRTRNTSSLTLANIYFCNKFQSNFKVKATESEVEASPFTKSAQERGEEVDCVGTGQDVECVVVPSTAPSSKPLDDKLPQNPGKNDLDSSLSSSNLAGELVEAVWEWGLLISPFFFWGTAMVAMKEVLPKTGPFFVSSFRLIPAGLLLVGFAALKGRRFPSGFNAWFPIFLFALVDAACFQGFLAEGLERTTAGLGSVIIDSQPLTVAILAALLFGESIGLVGATGLVFGVVGLLLLEVPAISFDKSNFSLWGSGEWWMLLAAQSMAVGTVMVRWVTKYSDPIMATGWHMVIGGIPLLAVSVLNHDPALSGSFKDLSSNDLLALLYTSIFGSAVSYGVYFYNATRGSLTKLSSLTFLTPMFASIFGFLYLDETFTPIQVIGALVIVAAIFMVNYKTSEEK